MGKRLLGKLPKSPVGRFRVRGVGCFRGFSVLFSPAGRYCRRLPCVEDRASKHRRPMDLSSRGYDIDKEYSKGQLASCPLTLPNSKERFQYSADSPEPPNLGFARATDCYAPRTVSERCKYSLYLVPSAGSWLRPEYQSS